MKVFFANAICLMISVNEDALIHLYKRYKLDCLRKGQVNSAEAAETVENAETIVIMLTIASAESTFHGVHFRCRAKVNSAES